MSKRTYVTQIYGNTYGIAQLAKAINIPTRTVYSRIHKKWHPHAALLVNQPEASGIPRRIIFDWVTPEQSYLWIKQHNAEEQLYNIVKKHKIEPIVLPKPKERGINFNTDKIVELERRIAQLENKFRSMKGFFDV